jgi:acyl carrier protein
VKSNAVGVLGHPDDVSLESHRTFRELGFDSLCAVQFRNRVNRATGLNLPASLVFDHPTLAAVSAHISSHFEDSGDRQEDEIVAQLEGLKRRLQATRPAGLPVGELAVTLRSMLAMVDQRVGAEEGSAEIEEAPDDDLFQFINDEFGIS